VLVFTETHRVNGRYGTRAWQSCFEIASLPAGRQGFTRNGIYKNKKSVNGVQYRSWNQEIPEKT
jgi:hypothetical protein